MNAITVKATRWEEGWELEISEDQHTQATTLAQAKQQVIDYLDTVDEDIDHSKWDINIIPEISCYQNVVAARNATKTAAEAQESAAILARAVARELRAEGLSVTDAATVMGVSRGRYSQLVNA